MKKKQHSGLSLRKKPSGYRAGRFTPLVGYGLFWGVLLLLEAAAGFITCGGWLLPAISGAVVCLLLTALWKWKRFCESLLLAVSVAAAIILREPLTTGILTLWEYLGKNWTQATGWLVLTPAVPDGSVMPFSIFVSVVLAVLCCQMAEFLPKMSAGILALAALALTVVLQTVQLALLLPVLALSVAVFAAGDRDVGVTTVTRLAAMAIMTAIAVVACLLITPVRDGSVFLQWRKEAAAAIHGLRYEQNDPQLPEGDFSEAVQEIQSDETVLRITMEQPEELYLRGFVGDAFDGYCWTAITKEAAADHSDLFYWLHMDGFWPQTQLGQVLPEQDANRVSVENVGACSRYLYTPYNMAELYGSDTLTPLNLQPGAVEAEGFSGQRYYSFSTVYQPEELLMKRIRQMQRLQNDTDYLSREGSYRSFVMEQDLQLPETGMAVIKSALDACAAVYGGVSTLSVEEAEACVALFLQKYLAEDDLLLPLEETAANTVYQTATAMVLALRYLGIPARYVEGYVISQELVQTAAPGVALEVPASCAAAWAEVYQDGIGWLPVELTPGFQAISGQISDSLQALQGAGLKEGSGDALLPEGEELQQEQEQEEEPEETDKPAQRTPLVSVLKSPVFHWLLLLIPVLLLIALWLRRKLILKRRLAMFAQEDHRQAVCCLFSDTAKLLQQLGLDRRGGSMLALAQEAEMTCPDLSGQMLVSAKINNEALFSSHPITQQQRSTVAGFRLQVLQHLKKTSKWYRKAAMQWLRCLY